MNKNFLEDLKVIIIDYDIIGITEKSTLVWDNG